MLFCIKKRIKLRFLTIFLKFPMKKIFLMMCFAFLALTTHAQKITYTKFLPSEDIRAKEGKNVVTGTSKDGEKLLNWKYTYSEEEEGKPYSFEVENQLGQDITSVQMTPGQFWMGSFKCSKLGDGKAVKSCLQKLISDLFNDCNTLGGGHCWYRY